MVALSLLYTSHEQKSTNIKLIKRFLYLSIFKRKIRGIKTEEFSSFYNLTRGIFAELSSEKDV